MIALSKRIAVALSLLCLLAGTSSAGTITVPISKLITSSEYYTDILGPAVKMTGGVATANIGDSPNDDGFAGPIDLGFTLRLFGTDYKQFWANNNGLVSFGGSFGTWDPGGLSAGNVAVIAPFFADVDTTSFPASGLMHLNTDIPNEIIVTWDNVAFYHGPASQLDSFQLVLRGPDFVIPVGEGQVGFFYKVMTWETGDASGGENGLGGIPAAIGFSDGTDNNKVLLESSQQAGIFGLVNDHHIWFTPDLTPGVFAAPSEVAPPPVPEPTTLVLVGTGAVFLGRKLLSRRRRG